MDVGQIPGTPVASGTAPIADTFRVQGIDPVTGEIRWEQQTVPGVATTWNPGLAQAPVSAVCAVDVASGTVVSIASGSADEDDIVVIGNISGGMFIGDDSDAGDIQAISIVMSSAAQSPKPRRSLRLPTTGSSICSSPMARW